jgi:demethylmenaquinone methyltransferase/2-methoxy-6-polyprenyl-1,4-benzoquinol methylase
MYEPSATIRLLRSADRLRGPAVASAIAALRLPEGSLGLDAGCGIGSHLDLLAGATAPGGRLIGLDSSAELLAVAEESVRRWGAGDRVSFRRGDAKDLPFEADTFDWVWSADCVGFIPGEPVELVREMARVARPGGTVALLLWSSQQLLPGYPFLEARLNGTRAGAAPATADWPPERHPLRALGWLSRAGLRGPAARTFVTDVHAPLAEDQRAAVTSLLEMRWGNPESELSAEDWRLYQRLRDRDGPESIVDGEDYFGFFTYTLFWGIVQRGQTPEGELI